MFDLNVVWFALCVCGGVGYRRKCTGSHRSRGRCVAATATASRRRCSAGCFTTWSRRSAARPSHTTRGLLIRTRRHAAVARPPSTHPGLYTDSACILPWQFTASLPYALISPGRVACASREWYYRYAQARMAHNAHRRMSRQLNCKHLDWGRMLDEQARAPHLATSHLPWPSLAFSDMQFRLEEDTRRAASVCRRGA